MIFKKLIWRYKQKTYDTFEAAKLHRLDLIAGLLIGHLFVTNFLAGFETFFTAKFILAFIALYSLGAGANLINRILDRKTDTDESLKYKDLYIEKISLRTEVFHLIAMSMISAATLYLIGDLNLAILFLLGYAAAYAYSAKPFRLKGKPFLGLLTNALGFAAIPMLSAYFLFGGNLLAVLLIIAAYSQFIIAFTLLAEIGDWNVDKKAGDLTTALFLGKKRSLALVFGLMVICYSLYAISAVLINNWIILTILSAPIVMKTTHEFYRKGEIDLEKNVDAGADFSLVKLAVIGASYLGTLLL